MELLQGSMSTHMMFTFC